MYSANPPTRCGGGVKSIRPKRCGGVSEKKSALGQNRYSPRAHQWQLLQGRYSWIATRSPTSTFHIERVSGPISSMVPTT